MARASRCSLALSLTLLLGLGLGAAGCKTTQLDICGEACRDDGGGDDKKDGSTGEDGGGIKWDTSGWLPDQRPPDRGLTCPSGTTKCGSQCCKADQICTGGTCQNLGPKCDELWPCPKGYYCDKAKGRCVPGASKCEYRPPVGDFKPTLKWQWTSSTVEPSYNQVMMAPMVANLTDDNKDGKIDRNDVPDIVFHTYKGSNYRSDGVMRAVSGDGKGEHLALTTAFAKQRTHPGTQLALGDIDADGKPEVVACASGGGVIALDHDGTLKWKNTQVSCNAPALADLDGDGRGEVVVCYRALRGATGALISGGSSGCGSYTTVADIDENGSMELVGGNRVYSYNKTKKQLELLWEDPSRPDGFVAIADLSGDKKPEIITASSSDHALRAYFHNGKSFWVDSAGKAVAADINQGKATLPDKCNGCGGGPPTVADFDGDGRPEIAAAAGWGYVVFEHDGSPKWFQATQDLSSRSTGSSVFDFEGDGKAEVIYSDELVLRIYQGATGKVLVSPICNTSGTLQEYPLVVDVDNDGHAEIVVANNNYAFKSCPDGSASSTGIKVISDAKFNWVKTRRIWNQHTYHVTNIDEDGRIPAHEPRNWDNPSLNNFRQNVQPGGLFDAPDLTGAPQKSDCSNQITATVQVKNGGAAKVAPGIKVTLYAKEASGMVALQTKSTQTTIYAGQSETLSFALPTPKKYQKQTIELYVRVDDDGTGAGTANECDEKNNQAYVGKVYCPTIS